jgi:hypothetical protein
MPTLLFNTNYLSILVPTESEAINSICEGDPFFIQCTGNCYAVSDLDQEWGITDFPLPTARWILEFVAAPMHALSDADEFELRTDGEWYLISLYRKTSAGEPMLVLCSADADRALWGVATNNEAASPLVAHLGSEDARVWLPVSIQRLERFDDMRDVGTLFASIYVRGESVVGWTNASVLLTNPFKQAQKAESGEATQGKLDL